MYDPVRSMFELRFCSRRDPEEVIPIIPHLDLV